MSNKLFSASGSFEQAARSFLKHRELKVTIRLPEVLSQRVRADATTREESPTETARRVLEEHYFGQAPIEELREQIKLLRGEVEELSRDVALSAQTLLVSAGKASVDEATLWVKKNLRR